MGQKPITENSLVNYRNFFQWLLAVVLMMLIGEFLISEIKSRHKRQQVVRLKKTVAGSLLLIVLLLPFDLVAQNDNLLIKKGQ
jgi:hypothetical protein